MIFNLDNNALLFDLDKNNYYWRKVKNVAINSQFSCLNLINALVAFIRRKNAKE